MTSTRGIWGYIYFRIILLATALIWWAIERGDILSLPALVFLAVGLIGEIPIRTWVYKDLTKTFTYSPGRAFRYVVLEFAFYGSGDSYLSQRKRFLEKGQTRGVSFS